MTMQAEGGYGYLYPSLGAALRTDAGSLSSVLLDATGEKVYMVGRVWWPGEAAGPKNISRVQFRWGTVTKAGGSAMTVSLEDVDVAGAFPGKGDGVVDQSVAVANADAAFATNTWYRTGLLSTNRSVSKGDRLAVGITYDGAGRLGTDAINVSVAALGGALAQGPIVVANTSGAYSGVNGYPILVLEFDDATYGTLFGAIPITAVSTHAIGSGSTAPGDEVGIRLRFPFPRRVEGFWAQVFSNAGGDYDLVLYDSAGTAVAGGSASVDEDEEGTNSSPRLITVPLAAPLTLAANTTYHLLLKPTTASLVTVTYFDVNDAAFWALIGGTAEIYQAHRTDAGAIGTTTTRRPHLGLIVNGGDDGAGGGGDPVSGLTRFNAAFN